MEDDPLSPPQAKKLIRQILDDGVVTYAQSHAVERMRTRRISTLGCENILRGGKVSEPEYENGTWRYQVHTGRMCVVIRFEAAMILQIVTAWRKR